MQQVKHDCRADLSNAMRCGWQERERVGHSEVQCNAVAGD
jgi:hypothetical protein